MKLHDRGSHFRYWTSKTDHYAKSYPDFSLGYPVNSETLFTCIHRCRFLGVGGNSDTKTIALERKGLLRWNAKGYCAGTQRIK